MLGRVIMWAFFWEYISRNFDEILSMFGIKHTPRKIQAEEGDSQRRWNFVNTRTSLVHSIVSGKLFFQSSKNLKFYKKRVMVPRSTAPKHRALLRFERKWPARKEHGVVLFWLFSLRQFCAGQAARHCSSLRHITPSCNCLWYVLLSFNKIS